MLGQRLLQHAAACLDLGAVDRLGAGAVEEGEPAAASTTRAARPGGRRRRRARCRLRPAWHAAAGGDLGEVVGGVVDRRRRQRPGLAGVARHRPRWHRARRRRRRRPGRCSATTGRAAPGGRRADAGRATLPTPRPVRSAIVRSDVWVTSRTPPMTMPTKITPAPTGDEGARAARRRWRRRARRCREGVPVGERIGPVDDVGDASSTASQAKPQPTSRRTGLDDWPLPHERHAGRDQRDRDDEPAEADDPPDEPARCRRRAGRRGGSRARGRGRCRRRSARCRRTRARGRRRPGAARRWWPGGRVASPVGCRSRPLPARRRAWRSPERDRWPGRRRRRGPTTRQTARPAACRSIGREPSSSSMGPRWS